MDTPPVAWGHVNLNVSDLERSIAFYEQLGFAEFMPGIAYLGITRDGPPAAIPEACATALGLARGTRARGCILGLPGGFPMLDLTSYEGAGSGEPASGGGSGWERICLASQDLDADVARLRAGGVEFLSDPAEDPGGLARIAICLDPDGHRIELIQIAFERWPRPQSSEKSASTAE